MTNLLKTFSYIKHCAVFIRPVNSQQNASWTLLLPYWCTPYPLVGVYRFPLLFWTYGVLQKGIQLQVLPSGNKWCNLCHFFARWQYLSRGFCWMRLCDGRGTKETKVPGSRKVNQNHETWWLIYSSEQKCDQCCMNRVWLTLKAFYNDTGNSCK
jgi:hypothetical protein